MSTRVITTPSMTLSNLWLPTRTSDQMVDWVDSRERTSAPWAARSLVSLPQGGRRYTAN